MKRPAEKTKKIAEKPATESLKKTAREMLRIVRKSPSVSGKASSKGGGRYFERKSSATRMREEPIAKSEITRESNVMKDYWIDCKQLEQFGHMKWDCMKTTLSMWLVQQEGVHFLQKIRIERLWREKVSKRLRRCIFEQVIGGNMRRNIENLIAAREAQQENLKIEAEKRGVPDEEVKDEWEKIVVENDTVMEWGYQKERKLLEKVPDNRPAVNPYRNIDEASTEAKGKQKNTPAKTQSEVPEAGKKPEEQVNSPAKGQSEEPEREVSATKLPPAKRRRSSERSTLIVSLRKIRDGLKEQLEEKRRKGEEQKREIEELEKQISELREKLAED